MNKKKNALLNRKKPKEQRKTEGMGDRTDGKSTFFFLHNFPNVILESITDRTTKYFSCAHKCACITSNIRYNCPISLMQLCWFQFEFDSDLGREWIKSATSRCRLTKAHTKPKRNRTQDFTSTERRNGNYVASNRTQHSTVLQSVRIHDHDPFCHPSMCGTTYTHGSSMRVPVHINIVDFGAVFGVLV